MTFDYNFTRMTSCWQRWLKFNNLLFCGSNCLINAFFLCTLHITSVGCQIWYHFNRPGHIFPLKYREGGVLKRAGHTEASVDLAVLAGLDPVAVLCEVVDDDDGSMARLRKLRQFAERENLKIISIADMIRYVVAFCKRYSKIHFMHVSCLDFAFNYSYHNLISPCCLIP